MGDSSELRPLPMSSPCTTWRSATRSGWRETELIVQAVERVSHRDPDIPEVARSARQRRPSCGRHHLGRCQARTASGSRRRMERVARLPSEAEWEYAARGGLRGRHNPNGDSMSPREANYASDGVREGGAPSAERLWTARHGGRTSSNGSAIGTTRTTIVRSPSRNPRGPATRGQHASAASRPRWWMVHGHRQGSRFRSTCRSWGVGRRRHERLPRVSSADGDGALPDRRRSTSMSHPEPNGPPDRTPISVGEVWENPVTRERATILERTWTTLRAARPPN